MSHKHTFTLFPDGRAKCNCPWCGWYYTKKEIEEMLEKEANSLTDEEAEKQLREIVHKQQE